MHGIYVCNRRGWILLNTLINKKNCISQFRSGTTCTNSKVIRGENIHTTKLEGSITHLYINIKKIKLILFDDTTTII